MVPSAEPISSCVKPSTSCITKVTRHPSGSASIAAASRSFKSGSAWRVATGTMDASSSTASRWSNRLLLRSPFSATDMAIVRSHDPNAASPRKSSSRSNARMNVSWVKSCARS